MRCLNCDALIPVGLSGEFCDENCKTQFTGECDPELLATLQGLNPNSIPQLTGKVVSGAEPNFKAPSLLHFSVEQAIQATQGEPMPGRIEDITSQLRDVSSAEIADAVKNLKP